MLYRNFKTLVVNQDQDAKYVYATVEVGTTFWFRDPVWDTVFLYKRLCETYWRFLKDGESVPGDVRHLVYAYNKEYEAADARKVLELSRFDAQP